MQSVSFKASVGGARLKQCRSTTRGGRMPPSTPSFRSLPGALSRSRSHLSDLPPSIPLYRMLHECMVLQISTVTSHQMGNCPSEVLETSLGRAGVHPAILSRELANQPHLHEPPRRARTPACGAGCWERR